MKIDGNNNGKPVHPTPSPLPTVLYLFKYKMKKPHPLNKTRLSSTADVPDILSTSRFPVHRNLPDIVFFIIKML